MDRLWQTLEVPAQKNVKKYIRFGQHDARPSLATVPAYGRVYERMSACVCVGVCVVVLPMLQPEDTLWSVTGWLGAWDCWQEGKKSCLFPTLDKDEKIIKQHVRACGPATHKIYSVCVSVRCWLFSFCPPSWVFCCCTLSLLQFFFLFGHFLYFLTVLTHVLTLTMCCSQMSDSLGWLFDLTPLTWLSVDLLSWFFKLTLSSDSEWICSVDSLS